MFEFKIHVDSSLRLKSLKITAVWLLKGGLKCDAIKVNNYNIKYMN